jgi:hypothetical protein
LIYRLKKHDNDEADPDSGPFGYWATVWIRQWVSTYLWPSEADREIMTAKGVR